MQHGSQYPYQPYRPSRPGKTVLFVVLVALGVLVPAGLGIGAVFLLTAKDDELAPATTPDEYTSLPRCTEVGARLADLPPLVRDDPPSPGGGSDGELELTRLDCSWTRPGAPSDRVTMSLAVSKQPGSGAGARQAAAGYTAAVRDGGKPIAAGIGRATKAADVGYAADGCGVRFYQRNVDVVVSVTAAGQDADHCRRDAHNLAEAVSAALGR